MEVKIEELKEMVVIKTEEITTNDTEALQELVTSRIETINNLVVPQPLITNEDNSISVNIEALEELKDHAKWFSTEYKLFDATRKEYFQGFEDSKKIVMTLVNTLKETDKNYKNTIDLATKKLNEAIFEERRAVIETFKLANVNEMQLQDEHFNEFWANKLETYVTAKTNFTSKGELTKSVKDNITNWSDKHSMAIATLEAIGLNQYKINGYDIIDAKNFQEKQKRLMAEQLENERIAKIDREAREQALKGAEEKARVNATQQVSDKIEAVQEQRTPEFTTEAPTTKSITIKFTYSEANANKLNEIVGELSKYATIEVLGRGK